MKKILFSVMTLVLVIGLVGAGAFAQFFDTETSTGNQFTAGTLDLTLTESMTMSFTLPPGMKPGDTASGTITVTNVGSLPGHLYETSWYVETDSSAPTEYTANMSRDEVAQMLVITNFTIGGVTPAGVNPGTTTVYDIVTDGSYISPLPGYAAPVPPLLSTGGLGWYDYVSLASGASIDIVLALEFNPLAGNDYQNDGITWTIEFLLTQ